MFPFLCSGGGGTPTTITISGNTTPADTYTGCTDTMIREVAPTTAYGSGATAADFEISNWAANDRQFGLIRFEALSNIPTNATVTAAKWKYWPSYTNDTIILQLHRCLRSWVEAEATWNQYSTGNNWGTAGALNSSDKSSTLSGSSTWTVAENQVAWKEISGTQFIADVQDMVSTPSGNNGWIIDASASASYSTYCQISQRNREFSFDHRHILEVTYTV